MTVIDTNHNVTNHLKALKEAGVTTVIRYIAAGLVSDEKVIKPAEALAMAVAGMRLSLVYEISGRPSGAAVGRRDGQFALDYAKTLGAPQDSVIWYTGDYDAQASNYPGIAAAFKAFKTALRGYYRVGCYASGYISDRLAHDGLIDSVLDAPADPMGGAPLIWLTDSVGFAGTRSSIAGGRYIYLQGLPRLTAGLDTDPDKLNARITQANVQDIGDFVSTLDPHDPNVIPASVVGSLSWVQNRLNVVDGAHLDVDGVNGPFTIKSIEKFQREHGLLVDGNAGKDTVSALVAVLPVMTIANDVAG